VHPQSVVHSMVEYVDGATIAQASPPDMHLPIALALGWPDRVPGAAAGCDWTAAAQWTFEPLDAVTFPAVDIARAAGTAGGTAPAVFNAANEECVAAFLAGRLDFLGIVDTVAAVVEQHIASGVIAHPELADVQTVEAWARQRAAELATIAVVP
jgi:1-deoxy-D-xylulose-5-phosphate reductoisomerase